MKSIFSRVCMVTCAMLLLHHIATAQTETKTSILKQAATIQAEKEKALSEKLRTLAIQKGWPLVMKRPNGGNAILVDVDNAGAPLYISTENNITAAATIGTNKLWPGGASGLNLNGSSNTVKDRLAIWDGGGVLPTHVELVGRILQKDAAQDGLSDHSTHVAGTLIASGVNPLAKGMSFGEQRLLCYDFYSDGSEMMLEAANLLVSNHSYGTISGWNLNGNTWEFRGLSGANEDYKFGYYSSVAELWDSIAYNAPYYMMVKSAGNNRDVNGPAVGAPYSRYDAGGNMQPAGNRPPGISNNDGYDIIPTNGVAKNILTIGAVEPISGGYSRPTDVVQSTFSSWGPTDDGRIKPDVVADGVDVLSSTTSSTGADNQYAVFSGTSMSSPNAAGSLLLLQEYYNQLHPGSGNGPGGLKFMRAATLKGIIIHTADEAGLSAGPDYQNGWGLINMAKAAAVITDDNTTHKQIIQENTLNNGQTFTLPVVASGNGTISATISWTDPRAHAIPAGSAALNSHDKRLINDLDIVIKKGATTWHPWILNPSSPEDPATTGDNTLDNVEKIELPDVVPGDTYTIQVTHKGILERGSQAYSLIVSGAGGQAYCASNPTSNAGAKIDSVSFGNIHNKNTGNCTTYNNYTNLTAGLQPGQTIPFFARLSNTCDVSVADKIVKVFLDANGDGDFDDAGETLATSAVINGNGDYNGTITIPSSAIVGKYNLIRIVMQETNVAANVTPCGTYTRGETQDYKMLVSTASTDVGITELVSPSNIDCASGAQFVSIRIANSGSQPKSAIPVSVVVKQGATTITTLTATYPGTINPDSSKVYTFQTPFILQANTAYTFTSSTSLTGDQATSNNENITTVTTRAASSNPTGTASICGTNILLKATGTSDVFTWYTTSNGTVPVATGNNTSTTTSAATYYLAKNDVTQHVGPANKLAFTTGGYLSLNNDAQIRTLFTTDGPMTIETARMYTGQGGRVTLRLAQINSFDFGSGAVNGFYVADYPVDVYATSPTVPPTTPVNDPADQGAIFRLGIHVPSAGTWAIIVSTTGTASLYRNNSIAGTNYPYTLPGIISLTGNGAVTTPPNTSFFQGFYYFFYDIATRLDNCPSARTAIVPTTIAPPTITLTGNTFTSSAPNGNQWLKNGADISGAVGSSYPATESGNYSVRVTDASGCIQTSTETPFSVTAVPNVDPAQIGLIVSPVPARGQFDIKLQTRTKADLDIILVSTSGQQVYHTQIPGFIGSLSKTIVPGKIAPGVYYLKIVHDKKMYIRKVIMIE